MAVVKVLPVTLACACFYFSQAWAGTCAMPTQVAINSCVGDQLKSVTAEINAVYNVYRGSLNVADKAQIKKVQLAWIVYRDAVCEFAASPVKEGSMYPSVLNTCLVRETEARTDQIKALIACDAEGGLRRDCDVRALAVAVPAKVMASESTPSSADINALTTYATVLGRGIACRAPGTQEASRRVGAWMDKTFPPGSSDHQAYMPVLTGGIQMAAQRQRNADAPDTCETIVASFESFPWP